MSGQTPREGDVIECMYEGRAVKWFSKVNYHCLAYPCPNLTQWFYIPRNSNLCEDCMAKWEATP